jgi:hypothetical protein
MQDILCNVLEAVGELQIVEVAMEAMELLVGVLLDLYGMIKQVGN